MMVCTVENYVNITTDVVVDNDKFYSQNHNSKIITILVIYKYKLRFC